MDAIAPSKSPQVSTDLPHRPGQRRQRFQEPHHTVFWNSFHSGNALIIGVGQPTRHKGGPFFVNQVCRHPSFHELVTLYALWLPPPFGGSQGSSAARIDPGHPGCAEYVRLVMDAASRDVPQFAHRVLLPPKRQGSVTGTASISSGFTFP